MTDRFFPIDKGLARTWATKPKVYHNFDWKMGGKEPFDCHDLLSEYEMEHEHEHSWLGFGDLFNDLNRFGIGARNGSGIYNPYAAWAPKKQRRSE